MQTYTCSQCGMDIQYEAGADLFQVAIDHLPKCSGKVATPVHKRITDIVPPDILAGNFITMDELLNQEVLVTGIEWKESTFKEDTDYLTLTIELDKEEKKLNTGAERVVAVFKAVKPEDLPVYCAFEKIQLPNGRRVYHVK